MLINDNICCPQKIFIKKFPGLSPEQIHILYQHSCLIELLLELRNDVIFPRVIDYDDSSITYEYLDLKYPFHDLVKNFSCTEGQILQIAKILKCLHQKWRLKNGLSVLHGDFVPHNFYIKNDKIIVIDPHPPESLVFDIHRLYGDGLCEVIDFIYCLLSDAGLKRSILKIGYSVKLTGAFLKGYRLRPIVHLYFVSYIFKTALNIFKQKRKAGFGFCHSLLHVFFGSSLTLFVIMLT